MEDQFILLITAVLAFISPVAISVVKKQSWTTVFKVALPIFISALLASWYAWVSGLFAGLSWAEAFLIAYGLQQLAYTTFLSKLTEWLEHNVGVKGKYEAD